MRLLFAITVCCLFAVMWIASSLSRHIRLAQLRKTRPARVRPATAIATLRAQTVPITPIAYHLPATVPTAELSTTPKSAPLKFTLLRRPLQSKRTSAPYQLVDLSRYTKDFGDLTDPYTNSLGRSEIPGPFLVVCNGRH